MMTDSNDQTTGVQPWKIRDWSALAILPAALVFCCLSLGSHAAETNSTPASTDLSRALIPSFNVQRYEITGSSTLPQETVDRAMSDATGDAVNFAQIRRALLKLRQAYRDRGYKKASVTLPQQPLTNGVVQVRVFEGPSEFASETQAVELPAWTVPAYDVRHFEIYGNATLTPEEIDRILSPAAGPNANLDQLQKALAKLQQAYRERGLSQASVTLPQQLLTDGTVTVQINEGTNPKTEAIAKTEQAITPQPPAFPAPPRTFEVQHYEVIGNSLLRQETIDQIFSQARGTNVTFPQIQKVLGDLQLAYRERGFASANVSLPPQQLTNATVKVQVIEGRLVDVQVTGNRYFSSNNVMRTLPSLQEAMIWKDEVVNSRVLQRELDIANQNRDRQIYPTINPGPEPGTSALTLKVKDRLPLHGRLEVNNQSTPGTPDWRINASANYNNLWQQEHSVGISYGFTPEEFKSDGLMSDYFFNRPLIANYGAYYRLPFGAAKSVEDSINSSGKFGYDEATHQFRLPPAGNRPDATLYASSSSSDTGVKYGPTFLIAQTPLLTILSRDSGQELTINDSGGGRLNFPFALSDTKRFSFSGGLDWKHYYLKSYNTNNFLIVTVITNSQGSQTIKSEVHSPQPVRKTELNYLPLALGADYFQTDKGGNFSASLALNFNFVGNDDDFIAASYSSETRAEYGKFTLALTRDQKLFKDWSVLLRANAQAAT